MTTDVGGQREAVQPTATACICSSSPPGSEAGSSGSLSAGAAATRARRRRLVTLAEARELALANANRKLAPSGGDPLSAKRRAAGVPTFAEAAERVLEQKRGGWRGRWHVRNWWKSMERYAFPRIGSRPVSEVNTADVLEILSPIRVPWL